MIACTLWSVLGILVSLLIWHTVHTPVALFSLGLFICLLLFSGLCLYLYDVMKDGRKRWWMK